MTQVHPRGDDPMMQSGIQWLSRTLAILIFMVGPGIAGGALDERWGTEFLAPTGFVIGGILGTGLLILLALKLTPPARGEPIPFDDEADAEDGADWDPKPADDESTDNKRASN